MEYHLKKHHWQRGDSNLRRQNQLTALLSTRPSDSLGSRWSIYLYMIWRYTGITQKYEKLYKTPKKLYLNTSLRYRYTVNNELNSQN